MDQNTIYPQHISQEERERRRKAIGYGRASVRLEGFVLDDEVEKLNSRYIDGEITRAQLSDELHKMAG